MNTTQTTDIMTLEQILPGAPASVLLSEKAEDARGQRRPFQQRVFVPDDILLHRLIAEAEIGGQIEATLVTEWQDSSSVIRLTSFRVAQTSVAAPQLRVA